MEYEWVEILEPETRKKMYANVVSGDCRWDAPPGQPVKACHNDQWWELFDSRSGRPYYFNAASQVTAWERPPNGDIIALSKLQKMQEQLAREQESQPTQQQTQPEPQPQAQPDPEPSYAPEVPEPEPEPAPPSPSRPQSLHANMHEQLANTLGVQQTQQRSASPTLILAAQDTGESTTEEAAEPVQEYTAPPVVPEPVQAQAPPPAPVAPPLAPTPPSARRTAELASAAGNADLKEFKDNLAQHKKGFIIKKKVSIASMLSWTKDSIRQPMLLQLKKTHKKEALEMFRMIQIYMKDRNHKTRGDPSADMRVAHEIVTNCWTTKPLRDEFYIQICKQTTDNRNQTSLMRGWELLVMCLNAFPPSAKFYYYLQGYIAKHVTSAKCSAELKTYAEHAYKKLERIHKTGAKRGNQAPSLDEVAQAKRSILNPSMFGSSLEEVLEVQEDKHPDLRIPWVVKVLAEAVLQHNGAQTEGIFRVPGDIDAVNLLKVSLDKGELPTGFQDPHVPGSALKLWFRELSDPLIPEELYDECIAVCANPDQVIGVVDGLPDPNRDLLMYIVRFLQTIGIPENQSITKMNYDNLSMVWAPNFLRCPSDDPMVIFQNTKKEMTFIRSLVLQWETDAADNM